MIVVTGGTKGIGRAIIEKFALEGYSIVTCSRKANDLADLKVSLEAKYDVGVYTQVADLSSKESCLAFADFVKGIGLPVQVLINNTGVFLPGAIHNEEDGTLEKQIETNLYSAYHLTRALIGDMVSRKTGHIFNMCSIASITAYANGGSYAISKHALHGFSKCLRQEMIPHGVRVTAVLPGATLTASWEGVDLPPERFMKPEDVAEVVWCNYKLSPQTVVEDIVLRPQLGDL
ncbi:MAG: SDR family NAD(P)-dependent oxidoreductase [Flammeovirgaceae bacterium]